MNKWLALVTVAAAACTATVGPPRGQVVLYVDTDAPIAFRGAQPTSGTPVALFDRVRFDVYKPGETTPCAQCSSEFAVDADAFVNNEVSIGIVPRPGSRVRIRLTTSTFARLDGEPSASGSIDTFVALPDVGADGITEVMVRLSTEDVGRVLGSLDASMQPERGRPFGSAVGQWAGATTVPCSSDPHPGEVCIPGGAFWMGARGDHIVSGTSLGWHRVVVVSPFFLDATEVTVAAYRARHGVPGIYGSGNTGGMAWEDWCNFTPMPGSREGHPVNCITKAQAQAFCQSRGGTLPTEAQQEFAMSGLLGRRFVWGDDDPATCADSVWGRNGYGIDFYIPFTCLQSSALTNGAGIHIGGSSPPGSGLRDKLTLPTGVVFDLEANVNEWSRDAYEPQTGACWSGDGVLSDPYCDAKTKLVVARGDSWNGGGGRGEASARFPAETFGANVMTGFRCARPDL